MFMPPPNLVWCIEWVNAKRDNLRMILQTKQESAYYKSSFFSMFSNRFSAGARDRILCEPAGFLVQSSIKHGNEWRKSSSFEGKKSILKSNISYEIFRFDETELDLNII